MVKRLFSLGDYVQIIVQLPHVAFGRCGTIVRLYPHAPGIYEVQLDGEQHIRFFSHEMLDSAALPGTASVTLA
jgi:hypothetical protein